MRHRRTSSRVLLAQGAPPVDYNVPVVAEPRDDEYPTLVDLADRLSEEAQRLAFEVHGPFNNDERRDALTKVIRTSQQVVRSLERYRRERKRKGGS